MVYLSVPRLWALVLTCSSFVAARGSKLQLIQAQPVGCITGEEGENRWCQVHDDGSVTLRNPKILRDKIKTANKRLEQGKVGEDSSTIEFEIAAANAVLQAAEEAETKYKKEEVKRLKKSSASDRLRVPSRFRCRKNKKLLELEQLEYKCTVTDYKVESNGGKDSDTKEKTDNSPEFSDADRCKELLAWQSKFQADKSEAKTAFWSFLAKAHQGFDALEKLKTHSLNYGTGTGKVLDALELKASKTYKQISKELHPDKQVKFFRNAPECGAQKQSLLEMMKQLFDRAADLKKCILKPLRCELTVPIRINDEL
mmetsp:Transcript_31401/g.68657  ORF Transcript_31401/g.68657 Transcript_31401/m.68657 type:complete len:312 (-) Transcript_31401:935-1870(-)